MGKMNKALGGVLFVCDGRKWDYSFLESAQCLMEMCDQVILGAFTDDDLNSMVSIQSDNCEVFDLRGRWEDVKGRYRLAYWANYLKHKLETEWYISQQADEVIHEDCFPAIREAIEHPLNSDGFAISRINLWGSPYTALDVPQDRKPVSTEVCRLARTKFDSVDDGESIQVPRISWSFLDRIRMYHTGFVRDKAIHPKKIIHLQEDVFQMGTHDARCDGEEVFDPWKRYNLEDVKPIKEELPKYLTEWARARE
jgi:hypothetical protein